MWLEKKKNWNGNEDTEASDRIAAIFGVWMQGQLLIVLYMEMMQGILTMLVFRTPGNISTG